MNNLIRGNVKYYSQTTNREFIELLRKYQPYTAEEEKSAFERLRNGDDKVFDDIVLHNQRWVYSMAKQYARDEIEVMDYVSEGNFGLMEAIERYNVDSGFKFITFAVWYIRRSMNTYMTSERDIVAKSNNAKLGKKLDKIKNDFFVNKGRFPSFSEIKTIFKEKYNIDVVNEADLHDLDIVSISSLQGDDETFEDDNEFTSRTSSYNEALSGEDDDYYREMIAPALNCLPEKNREFIKKLYHIGYDDTYTVQRISEEYGLDEDGVKKMENNILRYMRQNMLSRVRNYGL